MNKKGQDNKPEKEESKIGIRELHTPDEKNDPTKDNRDLGGR